MWYESILDWKVFSLDPEAWREQERARREKAKETFGWKSDENEDGQDETKCDSDPEEEETKLNNPEPET